MAMIISTCATCGVEKNSAYTSGSEHIHHQEPKLTISATRRSRLFRLSPYAAPQAGAAPLEGWLYCLLKQSSHSPPLSSPLWRLQRQALARRGSCRPPPLASRAASTL